MSSHNRRSPALLALVVAAAWAPLSARPARAQWGIFGGFNYVPSPGNFLDQRSLAQTARGPQTRPSHSPLSGNPNAYFNRVRDNGFVSHYDVQRRLPPAYLPEPRSSPGLATAARPEPQPQPQPQPKPKPSLPLASFFDATRRLVWPAESPVEGELKAKRDSSDEASLAVLAEVDRQGVASITSVTEARQRLLDYGRPALQEARQEQTLRIADSFHLFLLSLYESLAQAASPPPAAAAPGL
jgi:hypothetical protein